MNKHAVALVLDEIGTLMELLGEDRFRARAYLAAARAIDKVEGDLGRMLHSGELERLRGVGPATLRVIRELVETGESALHRQLRERTPDGLLELLAVPGLGAGKIHALHAGLGIRSIEELEAAALAGRVAKLKGFGEKTQTRILQGVTYVRTTAGRRRQPSAFDAAARLVGFLGGLEGVRQVKLAGEVRRRLETVDGVDALVLVDGSAPAVIELFLALPMLSLAERIEWVPLGSSGASRRSVGVPGLHSARGRLADGLELRIHCAPTDAFATAWVYATGSDAHLTALGAVAEARGLRLDALGLRAGERPLDIADEEALYSALDLEWIPPELRETGDEIEDAANGRIPRLLETSDLRGCFHCHTTFSDGTASVAEMARGALAKGWRYLGIADHSQASYWAGGLDPGRVRAQQREIDAWNERHGEELWLFKGTEADILPDGRIDYAGEGDDVLASFDYVIASVHSSFRMLEREQTLRVVRALESPYVTFLGHPTGRLLLTREGYELDLDAVVDAAAANGKGIEINANPRRLELDWRYWKRAKSLGVRAAINPDAHSVRELDNVGYGVNIARKGWQAAEDVVTTWELEEVKEYFRGGRR